MLKPRPVDGYALSWNIVENKGQIYLHFVSNQQVQIPVDSAQELAALGEFLRNSPTVAYDPHTQTLMAAVKAPGT